ncbi:hypothetical protein PVAP13_6NG190203 [Panicum virgatum]|uniref:Uncharacterized protein n=1 Tax=Panicum virgatum TaxID=38727 RepID=A0A8T0QXE8_PANVG|nr:hypothetical protein PVAP13_6NG190203 [Panicum virgatum]
MRGSSQSDELGRRSPEAANRRRGGSSAATAMEEGARVCGGTGPSSTRIRRGGEGGGKGRHGTQGWLARPSSARRLAPPQLPSLVGAPARDGRVTSPSCVPPRTDLHVLDGLQTVVGRPLSWLVCLASAYAPPPSPACAPPFCGLRAPCTVALARPRVRRGLRRRLPQPRGAHRPCSTANWSSAPLLPIGPRTVLHAHRSSPRLLSPALRQHILAPPLLASSALACSSAPACWPAHAPPLARAAAPQRVASSAGKQHPRAQPLAPPSLACVDRSGEASHSRSPLTTPLARAPTASALATPPRSRRSRHSAPLADAC